MRIARENPGATKAEDRAFLAGLPVFMSRSWLETLRPSPRAADVAKELARSLSWKAAGSGVVSAERWSCCVLPACVEGMPTAVTDVEFEHAGRKKVMDAFVEPA